MSAPGATFSLRAVDADGRASALFGPFTAGPDGPRERHRPGAVTRGARVSADNFYRGTLRLETADGAPAGAVSVSAPADDVVLEADFVSSKGWVKPGETYPFTLRVLNYGAAPLTGATRDPDAARRDDADTTAWDVPAVAAKAADGTPGMAVKVVEATADTLAQDPEIVWKNLSATATLTSRPTTRPTRPAARRSSPRAAATRPRATATARSRSSRSTTRDRKHAAASTATKLRQDQRPGQPGLDVQPLPGDLLRPAVPARDGAVRGDRRPRLGTATYPFTQPQRAVHGEHQRHAPAPTRPATAIPNGWYQLPGDTTYYGLDGKGSALAGALTGVGALQDIDSGCGPTGKAVYDAALIADAEIDYDRYDTDKDGVVDFFMMVFPGKGGNGASQTELPPYDNIWPHSSDLQNAYTDANGEKGYVTKRPVARPRGPAAVLDRRLAQREDDDATPASRSSRASARTTSTRRRRSRTRA